MLLLPLVLFHWMLPFASGFTIGNDYPRYSIEQQLELLFSLETGTFPLFVPGFGGGQSASALTLGQLFHPLPHLAARLPGYWDGNALAWNTALRLLTLAAAHLALFRLLRRLRVSPFAAFALTAVTVYNLRMLDLFRYGAALEAWTGHLFLCAALGAYFSAPERALPRLAVIGSVFWLVASGHPQMMYLGLLGGALFAVLAPAWMAAVAPGAGGSGPAPLRAWLGAVALAAAGVALAAAYLLPFYVDFVAAGTARVGRDYAWADGFRDTFPGTVNSWLRPLGADVHGAFGVSSLFLFAASAPLARLVGVRVPPVVWAIWIAVLAVFACVQGGRTGIHRLTWEVLPLASAFRVAGRWSMLLPVLLMMLGAWLLTAGRGPRGVAAAAAFAGGILVAYRLLADGFADRITGYAPVAIRDVPDPVEPLLLAAGLAGLAAVAVHAGAKKRAAAGLVLCAATVTEATLVLAHGTWRESARDTPTLTRMAEQKRQSLAYRHEAGLGLYAAAVVHHLERAPLPPDLARLYPRHLPVRDRDHAYRIMARGRRPDQVVLEGAAGRPPAPVPVVGFSGEVTLRHATFNRLVFRVRASGPAHLGLALPFTGHWRAAVDGAPVRLLRADGWSLASPVPAGEHRVTFTYDSPAARLGVGISCLALAGLGLAAGWRRRSRAGRALAAVGIGLGAGGFAAWHGSLHGGESLGTAYEWRYRAPGPVANLAFGRRAGMSSQAHPASPDWFHPGRGIDGSRAPRSGFLTEPEPRPLWYVDFREPTAVGSVVLHESLAGEDVNPRPLVVALSDDRVRWRVAAKITAPPSPEPVRLTLPAGTRGRYLSVQSLATGRLALDEVEAYPPANPR